MNLKRKGGDTDEVAPSKRARLNTPKEATPTAPAPATRTGSVRKMVAARHILQVDLQFDLLIYSSKKRFLLNSEFVFRNVKKYG